MKRINIFVLLCVLVFTMSACAWADAPTPAIVPINDHGPTNTTPDPNTDVKPSDYAVTSEKTNDKYGSTADKAILIKISGSDLKAHYNQADTHELKYWVGFGLEYKADMKVYFGTEKLTNTKDKFGN